VPSSDTGRPLQLTDESDLDELLSEQRAVLVEFYTRGCGICQSMVPVLGNVAREGEVPVAMINPRDDPPLIDRYQVQSVPLFVLFVDREPVDRRAEGFIGTDDLLVWIEKFTE